MPDPFSALLVRLRADANKGLRETADALGLKVVDLSAWENGRKRPAWIDLDRLVMFYGHLMSGPLGQAAAALSRLPLTPPAEPIGPVFVSHAHQEGNEACPCNECRAERFEANRCTTCAGSGLRPGFDG